MLENHGLASSHCCRREWIVTESELPEFELPFVVAMLTCDTAITEARTNKKTLVGVFDKIMVQEVPTIFRPFWLYAKLADLRGAHRLRIEIVHLGSEKKIIGVEAETRSPNGSTDTFEFAMPVPPMPIPLTGTYEIQLFSDNIFIGRTVVTVIKGEKKQEGAH
jgi:hypothetical protein